MIRSNKLKKYILENLWKSKLPVLPDQLVEITGSSIDIPSIKGNPHPSPCVAKTTLSTALKKY